MRCNFELVFGSCHKDEYHEIGRGDQNSRYEKKGKNEKKEEGKRLRDKVEKEQRCKTERGKRLFVKLVKVSFRRRMRNILLTLIPYKVLIIARAGREPAT